jgi:hypothetical protein
MPEGLTTILLTFQKPSSNFSGLMLNGSQTKKSSAIALPASIAFKEEAIALERIHGRSLNF